jgi:hypothetical protein
MHTNCHLDAEKFWIKKFKETLNRMKMAEAKKKDWQRGERGGWESLSPHPTSPRELLRLS